MGGSQTTPSELQSEQTNILHIMCGAILLLCADQLQDVKYAADALMQPDRHQRSSCPAKPAQWLHGENGILRILHIPSLARLQIQWCNSQETQY